MTDEAMSPLRRRMIEDMTVRKFVEKTQKDYIRHVKELTAFLGRSPATATAEELRLYQLHLAETGVRPPTINSAVSALRFFFSITVDRAAVTKPLTYVAEPRKIPVVLSPEEVARFLEAAPGPKYKAALSAAYGAGLRVSEVVALKVSDVDSMRMLLRIEQGKGRKDRCAMLSPQLLELLRDWWRIARPPVWLFPGQNPVNHLTTRQLNRAVHAAAQTAEISKRGRTLAECETSIQETISRRTISPSTRRANSCRCAQRLPKRCAPGVIEEEGRPDTHQTLGGLRQVTQSCGFGASLSFVRCASRHGS